MKTKTNILIYFFLLPFAFILYTCKDDPPVAPPDPPPPPPPPVLKDTIAVTIEDVMHRSIVVNVKTTTNNRNSFIELYRTSTNTTVLTAEYPITVTDTTIVDDNNGNNLQLNTEYTYFAVRRDTTEARKDTSNIVTAKTLNATNFNYTWQEYSFGSLEYGPNVLYDIWGSDENNVWAIGGFYDDNRNFFGALHFNGSEWTSDSTVGGVAIYGFARDDIWVAGGGVFHYDGNKWSQIDSYTSGNQSIPLDEVLFNNKPYASIWGTSSSNLYFGNQRGKIVHWDGNKATVVYSHDSNVQVKDLDGYDENFIVGVGIGMIPPLLAVYYDGTNWNKLPIENDPSLNSVAIVSKNHIYFGGDGIFKMKGNSFSQVYNPGYYIWGIEYNREIGLTVAAGDFDGIYIHNGLEWRNYKGQISSDKTSYSGIFLINNTIFCVGSTLNEAKIIIGRNN